MTRLKSFEVNHYSLTEGVYLSRVDKNTRTYDLRFKKPNGGDYLDNAAMHTLEHLMATYVRNSEYADQIVYFGPMGCRTGFYLIVFFEMTDKAVLNLVKDSMRFVLDFEGEIPGASEGECGHYLEHDLVGAKMEANAFFNKIKELEVKDMEYPK